MVVNIKDIIAITNRILNKYQSINNEFIDIKNDYYWFIDAQDSYNMNSVPNDICVGSLDDDINKLNELLQDDRDVNILDLERISNVLKILNFEIVISEDRFL